MATHKLLLLPGDGIGPEVMAEVKKLIAWMNDARHGHVRDRGGAGRRRLYDAHKAAISDATMAKAHAADAVIFGAVGGPKWDKVPYEVRPEAGLLRLRKELRCSPISARRSAIRRSPMLHRSSARWSRASTS